MNESATKPWLHSCTCRRVIPYFFPIDMSKDVLGKYTQGGYITDCPDIWFCLRVDASPELELLSHQGKASWSPHFGTGTRAGWYPYKLQKLWRRLWYSCSYHQLADSQKFQRYFWIWSVINASMTTYWGDLNIFSSSEPGESVILRWAPPRGWWGICLRRPGCR
jgi:hypothetical protein